MPKSSVWFGETNQMTVELFFLLLETIRVGRLHFKGTAVATACFIAASHWWRAQE